MGRTANGLIARHRSNIKSYEIQQTTNLGDGWCNNKSKSWQKLIGAETAP